LSELQGTNGKTTVATMFFNMLRAMGVSCGLMSTVKICLNELTINTSLTTPDIFSVYRYLKMMVDQDFNHAIMEVSSHAIDQGRVAGLEFAVAAFTNISHDHLDYHRTFRSYLETKQRLFTDLSQKAVAITNVDDRNGEVMTQLSKAKIKTYGLRNVADYKAKLLEFDFSGMHIQIGSHDFYTHLVGKFNVSNLLAVVAIADQLGFERMEVLTKLSQVKTAPGRFELVRNQQKDITSIVDYAHTPDALENVLKTIDQVNKRRGKVITVIGCGGDRDKTKRPLMAKVASRYSNQVILTSDNPRSENPEAILDDMEEGVEIDAKRKVLRIADRKSAIKTAVTMAQKQDVILVAGKGHETHQEIQGVKYPFDDKQILQDFLLE
jgi:UDP-N-acetylmuramoyl-L-alanyl-D-glutamate--2,6-diaminopimelate ligase